MASTAMPTAPSSGPGSTEDLMKAVEQLLATMVALAPQATGVSHAMGLILRDAARWQALFKPGGRVRVLGTAKLGQRGYQHIGLELWTEHPCAPGYDASDREALKTYADAARQLGTEGDPS